MNKDKKQRLAWIIGTVAIVAVALALLATGGNGNYNPNKMTLFYSNSCPHCLNVENYIEANKVQDRFDFQRLEVSASQRNSQRLIDKAQACGLDTNSLGVPFLWTGDKCLMGDEAIIEFFKS
ncbi:MAG: hypothetical protein ACM3PZ_02090 [Bacillota bacterium]